MSTRANLLEGYIPIALAASELGIHLRTLKRWKTLHYGPSPVRVGKRLYYRREELVSWLDNLGKPEKRSARK